MDKLLFETGNFTSASGLKLDWKIECDALSDATLVQIGKIAAPRIPRFSHAFGVPTGGLRVSRAMQWYADRSDKSAKLLVCEDVWTTGASWRRFVAEIGYSENEVLGFCLFSRSEKRLPHNVHAFFEYGLPNPNNRG